MSGDGPAVALALTIGTIGFFAGYTIGSGSSAGREREAAVKAGAARYEVNPQTGQTRFVYLKPGSY